MKYVFTVSNLKCAVIVQVNWLKSVFKTGCICEYEKFMPKSMGTLTGAPQDHIKCHSRKCCGIPYDLPAISGV